MDQEPPQPNQALRELRLLTEVNTLLAHRRPDGTYPHEVRQAVHENLRTKAYEDGASAGISTTLQPIAEVRQENGEKRRAFIWRGIGKTALQVAESGYDYHFSNAAFKRVSVEVKEAARSEQQLRPGVAQVMISPRMSAKDAPQYIAKNEHLADEDALRVYTAVTDAAGNVIGRQTQSILVRDVPLNSWVAMLKSPANIFGRSFEITDDFSALSVMELFSAMDLPAHRLPNGPVTLLRAVLPYVMDPTSRASIEMQLRAIEQDQVIIMQETMRSATKWLDFELQLAESLYHGVMQAEIQAFVVQHQNIWPEQVRMLLKQHETNSGSYSFSKELAGVLEQAKHKLLMSDLAIAVNDQRTLQDLDTATRDKLRESAQFMRLIEGNYTPQQVAEMSLRYDQELIRAALKPGGGCGPKNEFEFEDEKGGSGSDEKNSDSSNEGIGKKSIGVCRTVNCPSRQAKIEVGGCSVCLRHCQPLWNLGIDPSKVFDTHSPEPVHVKSSVTGLLFTKELVGAKK